MPSLIKTDIGAFWGIKGYEEQVTEVGTHRGHMHWPQTSFLGTFDSGSVRRGFLIFARNCANCHGMIYKKYDALLDKGYKQLELAVRSLSLRELSARGFQKIESRG
jgi:ubiquinol-cytochrome c reductase cytochrome c1 subunit